MVTNLQQESVTNGYDSFLYYLEETLNNAFIVYRKEGENKIKKFMLFRVEVIREMLEDAYRIPTDTELDFPKGQHLLLVATPSESNEKPQKRCVVC